MPDAPDDAFHVATELRMAVFRLARRIRAERVVDSLTDSQFSVLLHVARFGPRPLTMLADREHVTAPSMSYTVSALAGAGYVQRVDDPADRRRVLVEVTELGAKVVAETQRLRNAWLEEQLTTVPSADRAVLLRAAEVIDELAHR